MNIKRILTDKQPARQTDRQNSILILLVFVFSFALFFVVSYCGQLTTDDMEFIGERFKNINDIIEYIKYYGNGRILGNFFSIILSYSRLLRSFVRAFVVSSIIVLLPKVLGSKHFSTYLVSFLMFTGCCANMFGQCYLWVSGFSNYVIPIFITLLVLYVLKHKINSIKCLEQYFWLILVFALGFLSQLFVEHTTCINILIAVFLFLAGIKNKENIIFYSLYLFSTLLGGTLMFLWPKLFYLPNNRCTGYRNIDFFSNSFLEICEGKLEMVYDWFNHSYLFIIALAFLALYMLSILKIYLKTVQVKICATFIITASAFLLIGIVYLDFKSYSTVGFILEKTNRIFMLLLVFVCILELLLVCIKHKASSFLLFLIGMSMISSIPFLFISPIGTRCVYMSYCFFVTILLVIYDGFAEKINVKYIDVVLVSVSIALSMVISLMSLSMYWLDNIRCKHIVSQMEKNSHEIEVFTIDSDYTVSDNGDFYGRQYYYKEWNDIDFVIIDMEEWLEKYR